MRLLLLIARPVPAQPRPALTTADYARAESRLSYNTDPLIFHSVARTRWLADGRFWYRTTTPNGSEFITVDSSNGARSPAFDHGKLAAALSAATGSQFDAGHLPFTEIDLPADGRTVTLSATGRAWNCGTEGGACSPVSRIPPAARPNEVLSPDGKHAAFLRDYNLWVRDVGAPPGPGAETQLTKDGVKDFGYATDNAGWTRSDRPVVVWSPDSTKLATFQQDERGVGEMYLVDTRVGHPQLLAWKYPMAGDAVVTTIQRVIVDVAGAHVVRLQMPPDQHRSTWCDDLACRGNWGDVQWSPDSTELAFASVSRDHKVVQVRVAAARTGAVRDVFEERVATFFGASFGHLNWKYLPASREVIWCSERDNWSQLYLYDLDTGKLKNQITTGDGAVLQVQRFDEKDRLVYFTATGKEAGRDPYFPHLYRVGFDGKNLTLLTPEDANHEVSLSPDGRYFTDRYSKPDVPPIFVLRNSAGKLISTLERADISRLLATGWKPPIPITVKARDGSTDLYGLMYQPTNLDRARKYPIINHIYPNSSVWSRSFTFNRTDCQALAELGFIVVEIDGLGSQGRSKKFFDFAYGDIGDATIPDQVAGMKELARRYPWIDIDRAGIHGHSGGGQGTVSAMFHFPDFFKVGVAQAGDHENRGYEDDWVESAQGLLERKPDGTTNYDNQANQNFAKNLRGRLLLAHGTMDTNVPFHNTLLVVSELIKANKDFDLILLPNRNHGFGSEAYMMRRRWDYFVRYLLGAEPPQGYELHPPVIGRPPG